MTNDERNPDPQIRISDFGPGASFVIWHLFAAPEPDAALNVSPFCETRKAGAGAGITMRTRPLARSAM